MPPPVRPPGRRALAVLVTVATWLAWPAATAAVPVAAQAPAVTRTVLPPLPGADPAAGTPALDIDNLGRVVGASDGRPVVWRGGEAVELTGFDAIATGASHINDRGQIVVAGYSAELGDMVQYLWHDGRVVEIQPRPGVRGAYVYDLNERGQVLLSGPGTGDLPVIGIWHGGAFTEVAEWDAGGGVPSDPNQWVTTGIPAMSEDGHVASYERRGRCGPASTTTCESRAVVWHRGVTTVLPGTHGQATGVNRDGHVIGTTQQGGVVWRGGEATPLGFTPRAINDRGQVIGVWQWWSVRRAVLWQDGRAIDLGTLGGQNSWARAINERGQVLGVSETATGEQHAFLWQDGEMVDLTPHGRGPEFQLWLQGFNDRGQAIGYSDEGSLPFRGEVWQVGQSRSSTVSR